MKIHCINSISRGHSTVVGLRVSIITANMVMLLSVPQMIQFFVSDPEIACDFFFIISDIE